VVAVVVVVVVVTYLLKNTCQKLVERPIPMVARLHKAMAAPWRILKGDW